jgi:hypothetical protein
MSYSKSLYEWENFEVCSWLNINDFKNYIEIFKHSNITGYDLCFITNDDLKSELKISNLHERLKLLKEIRKLVIDNCN